MTDQPDESCFPTTRFQGWLAFGDVTADVTFAARAGENCRLIVDPVLVDDKTYIALSKAMGLPGEHGQSVKLTGESSDGALFSSIDMDVSGCNNGSDGFEIHLTPGEAEITLPRSKDDDDGAVDLLFLPNSGSKGQSKAMLKVTNDGRFPEGYSTLIWMKSNDFFARRLLPDRFRNHIRESKRTQAQVSAYC